ncbi:hypothetical protein SH580_16785 [Coraliomargarita algicola]|uniref:Lipoprotein n=1 Tax=Coraliomargarita algicola TaxID=3092156 RepID=A0ABZ0RJ34_9BACT|nr:hypothetical protein [Coraliomargarita sp. J2-16]WPJ95083.1 hypothetical protein SH580_16785 [Coraliomargarita sp. J2-16]
MRFLITALLCSLFAGCASTPRQPITSVNIEEIKPRYIETESFKRISEYMSGKENLGDRVVLRTQPQERAGYYFTLILDTDVRRLPAGTVVVGEFYTKKSVEKQSHEFTLPNKRPTTKEIFVGLTGEDWPEDSGVPAAWKFSLKDANGQQLGEKQSYLWSL